MTDEEPRLTITGTFDIRTIVNLLKKYKKGDLDEGQLIIALIESLE